MSHHKKAPEVAMNVKHILFIVLVLPTVALAQPTAKRVVEQVSLDQHLGAELPLDAMLVDEQGQTVRLGDYFHGKPVIVNFVYFRCPMLCTQVLNGLLTSSQGLPLELARDYEIVSISIDPNDTPAMAAAKKERYVEKYRRSGGDAGWHFLTADEATIAKLTEIAGFRYAYDAKTDQFAHASGIIVATPEGRLARYLYGIDYPPTDLRLALVEASEGKIGSLVDQFLLLCYHYDPQTGRYGLVIARLIQGSGILTATCLGGFLIAMYRKERRLSRAAKEAT
jgi:protein SCO1/2